MNDQENAQPGRDGGHPVSPFLARLTYTVLGLALGVAATLWLAPLPQIITVAICPAPVFA